MMKTYQYLEVSPAKGIGFALAYVAILLIILSLTFGGFSELAGAVNNFGNSKAVGFLTGIACIAPIFFLIKFIYPKINILTDESKITVIRKGQTDLLINYTEIYGIVLNAQRINTLSVYGNSGEVLFHIQPFNNHHIMQEIVKDVTSKSTFKKSITKKKMLNTTYDMVTYVRIA